MDTNLNFFHPTTIQSSSEGIYRLAKRVKELNELNKYETESTALGEFKKITPEDMPTIWNYLCKEPGRTTDFSYGGLLMWVDYFNYEYAIYKNTLFIKGVVENDISTPAFSLPIGELPIKESITVLKEYCEYKGINLEFSAVPEYALPLLQSFEPVIVEELSDWGDYLYDCEPLATLKGKKMSKKRNHVNQFMARYPDWKAVELTAENAHEATAFMDIFDGEGDSTEMAKAERLLSRKMIDLKKAGNDNLLGMILYVGNEVCAYTIGDIKGDTLFIHVEKATRKIAGSYEMINYLFAKAMSEKYPQIVYINREDDAGDIGLRMAKESYHPKEILKKYNIVF